MERDQIKRMEEIVSKIFDSLKQSFLQKLEQGTAPDRAFEDLKNTFLSKFVERLITVEFVPEALKPEEVKQIVEEVLEKKTQEILERIDKQADRMGENFKVIQDEILDNRKETIEARNEVVKGIKWLLEDHQAILQKANKLDEDMYSVLSKLNETRRSILNYSSSLSGIENSISRVMSDIDRKERGW